MIIDPIKQGLASGWDHRDGALLTEDLTLEADVAIIGSGAGGGVSAEILSQAGLKVLIIEEGPLKSSSDFKMMEKDAYPALYQESAGRQTADKAINIFQGRAVGGTTVVNWTTSFRTPDRTLDYWQKNFAVEGFSAQEMLPWFLKMEQRLSIDTWQVPPNENNSILQRGLAKLGIPSHTIRRNVLGCWNLGYCGMGCPTNAKQSMLVTTLPAALNSGATLISRCRVEKIQFKSDQVIGLECLALDASGNRPSGTKVTVKAKHYVLAGGAINSPALLLRSKAADPNQTIGARTFLHPVNAVAAEMPKRVEAYSGAPQSIYSDYFQQQDHAQEMGFKLEVPPLHPVLMSIILGEFGEHHASLMQRYPRVHAMIALLRDGFHEQSQGGQVKLRDDGSPLLDYPITDYLWDGFRRAWKAMAETQFAAGAHRVIPMHSDSPAMGYSSWQEARREIDELPLQALKARLLSAHVMGGCAMGEDPKRSVVNSQGRFHHADNLWVFDGSAFPTSISANPQLSIYGLAAKQASGLAQRLTGTIPVSQSA